MKLSWCALILAFSITTPCFSYISGIAIQSQKGTGIQVYVNGKLYTKNGQEFVRIRSNPGLFHIELRVFSVNFKQWQVVKKDVRLQKGYDSYFKVFLTNGKPELREVKKYPIYSKYFLNPALYNRHPIS